MKRILILLFFSFYVSNGFASTSPQSPDYLIYKNDTIPTYNLLVEQYLQKIKKDDGRLFNLSFRNSVDGFSGTSPNCWRGYQAIYKIENDSLFVTNIIECHSLDLKKRNLKNYISEIFGDKVENNKVFIDWFSGSLSFPIDKSDNKIIRFDGVFENIYMFEKVLKIKNGSVINIKNVQNYQDLKNGIDRLDRYAISAIFFERIKNYKWTKIDKIDCSELYTIVIGKDGRIADVFMSDYNTKELIKGYLGTKKEFKHCIKSVKKAISDDLKFDILKQKGEPIEDYIYLEIWFNEDGTIENWSD